MNCDADKHCVKYFDGCNECGCKDNEIAVCTQKLCQDNEWTVSGCLICEDPETMQHTFQGSCDKTCDKPLGGACPRIFQNKCECKPGYPYYSAELGKCITADQCPSTSP